MLPASIVPRVLLTGVVCAGMYACSSETVANPPSPSKADASSTVTDAGSSSDAAVSDGGTLDANVDKAAGCASTFGSALTKSFGRLDGTVTAIVQPKDQQCALPNNDHVVVQVKFGADVYRVVVNIQSDFGTDLRVRYGKVEHALVGGAWAEGWHPDASLDYVSDLGLHANAAPFQPFTLEELSPKIAADIDIGDKVSLFSDSSGGASSHKVHRNGSSKDGAIVLHATSAKPQYLVFHFDTQTF